LFFFPFQEVRLLLQQLTSNSRNFGSAVSEQ